MKRCSEEECPPGEVLCRGVLCKGVFRGKVLCGGGFSGGVLGTSPKEVLKGTEKC